MTAIAVSVVDRDTVDALVESVTALFKEDAGQHDLTVDTMWPVHEGTGYYSSIVTDPACLLLLATAGERPVGHLVGKLREPTSLQPVHFAVLESMRVVPDLRRAGIGAQLVQHFLSWAREHGARLVSVTAYAGNTNAQRFYARHGFVPQAVTLRTDLAAPSGG
jgi:GNAT superfamily N-acetyltransferase